MGRVSALICLRATVENQDLRAKVDQRSVAERKDHGCCVEKVWGQELRGLAQKNM